jgi:hypothetical protein
MKSKILLMLIPSGVLLGLLGTYLMIQGVGTLKLAAIIVLTALVMSIIMERIIRDTYDEEDDDNDQD